MKSSELAAEIEMARSTWEVAVSAAKKPEANVYGLTASDLADIVRELADNYGDMDGVYWKGVGIDMLAHLLDAKLYHEKYGAAS